MRSLLPDWIADLRRPGVLRADLAAGLTGAVTFTKTNHLGNVSVILQKVQGGKWVTVGKFIK